MSELNKEELKPCPFCGTKALLVKSTSNLYKVGCTADPMCPCWHCGEVDCDCCDNGYAQESDAIKHWNARSFEAKLKSRIKTLEEALEDATEFLQCYLEEPEMIQVGTRQAIAKYRDALKGKEGVGDD